MNERNVLLVKRGQEPAKGEWSIPGGMVELGETLSEAAHREVREECNIDIKLIKQFEPYEFIEKDANTTVKYHYVIHDFLAKYIDGDLSASSDISDARWYRVSEIRDMDLSMSIKLFVQKARAALDAIEGFETHNIENIRA